MEKLYYKIGEVSKITGVEPYILRYWEQEFKLLKPIRTKTNQRLYQKRDIESILKIKKMLYEERFTIAGAKKRLRQESTPKQQHTTPDASLSKYKELIESVKNELKEISKILGSSF